MKYNFVQEEEEILENTEEISEVVDYLDTNSILSTHKPMVAVKTETFSPVRSLIVFRQLYVGTCYVQWSMGMKLHFSASLSNLWIKRVNSRSRVYSFFHRNFSPLSTTAGGSNPAGQSLTFN